MAVFAGAGRFFAAVLFAVFCSHLVLFCILPVSSLEPLGSFFINILLFIDKKKKNIHRGYLDDVWYFSWLFFSELFMNS